MKIVFIGSVHQTWNPSLISKRFQPPEKILFAQITAVFRILADLLHLQFIHLKHHMLRAHFSCRLYRRLHIAWGMQPGLESYRDHSRTLLFRAVTGDLQKQTGIHSAGKCQRHIGFGTLIHICKKLLSLLFQFHPHFSFLFSKRGSVRCSGRLSGFSFRSAVTS